MGIFGRLTGNQLPKLPAGAHAYVDGYGPLRDHYCVRVRTGPDLSADDNRIGPVFGTDSGAQMFADYANGVASLDWNVNGASRPV
jgi:hypothetical protein